ncbi:MAG: hypothetical protein U9Q22_02605, partial [Candidatus Altiarchaeota archaeon]|nr:hypothetical protein [Candidatus Altiarchaeota archaeon]
MKRKSPTLFVLIILALTASGFAECTDSDVTANYPDGMNWYTPGYIICNGIRNDDTCGTGANEGWLTEYYCVGGSRGQASAHCPVGYLCTAGACVQGGECVIDADCPNSFPGTMTTYCTGNSACASYVYDYCS